MKQETSSKIQKKYIYVSLPIIVFLVMLIFIISFQAQQGTVEEIQHHIAIIETNLGNITIQLYDQDAPLSTDRFINLQKTAFIMEQ